MAIQQFMATVRSDGSLKLPPEAQESLHLKQGEAVLISLDRSEASQDSQATPDPLDFVAFFAEADAIERQPLTLPDPQKSQMREDIAEKHQRMGMKIPC